MWFAFGRPPPCQAGRGQYLRALFPRTAQSGGLRRGGSLRASGGNRRRRGLDFDTARKEIIRMSGSQFDPAAVEAFLSDEASLREMVALQCSQCHGRWIKQLLNRISLVAGDREQSPPVQANAPVGGRLFAGADFTARVAVFICGDGHRWQRGSRAGADSARLIDVIWLTGAASIAAARCFWWHPTVVKRT